MRYSRALIGDAGSVFTTDLSSIFGLALFAGFLSPGTSPRIILVLAVLVPFGLISPLTGGLIARCDRLALLRILAMIEFGLMSLAALAAIQFWLVPLVIAYSLLGALAGLTSKTRSSLQPPAPPLALALLLLAALTGGALGWRLAPLDVGGELIGILWVASSLLTLIFTGALKNAETVQPIPLITPSAAAYLTAPLLASILA